MNKIQLVILFFNLSYFSLSQEPIFNSIGFKKDIPANETYNIIQDSKGYIWFSTEAGVCRFDGNSIKVYAANEGLPEKGCYGIYEDPQKKMWFITSNNRVLFYNERKDKLEEAEFSKALRNEIGKNPISQLYFIKEFDKNSFWLCTQWCSYKVNHIKNKFEILSATDSTHFQFVEKGKNLYPLKLETKYLTKPFKNKAIELQLINSDTLTSTIAWKSNLIPQWRCLTISNQSGDCFIGWDNHLIKINSTKEIEVYVTSNSILNLYVDKGNTLWVGTLKDGAYCFSNSDLKKKPIHVLQDLSVTGICEDYENSIWCSTLEQGVFYCKNRLVLSYSGFSGLNKKQELFCVINNTLFCNENANKVIKINENDITPIQVNVPQNYLIKDMIAYNNGYLLASYNGVAITDNNFRKLVFLHDNVTKQLFGASSIIKTKNADIYFLQSGSLYKLKTNSSIAERIDVLKSQANCINAIGDTLLVGCKDGLYMYFTENLKSNKIKEVVGSVSDISILSEEEIWVGTKDNGIYVKRKNKFENVSKQYGLENSRIFDLDVDRNQTLWIASNKGLVKVKEHSTVLLNANSGLPSNEINKIAISRNLLYMSTNEGVYSVPISVDLINNTFPKIYLNKIYVNDVVKPVTEINELPHDMNSIRVQVDALTYSDFSSQKIYYEIESNDSKKVYYIKGNEIKLDNLPPDLYHLKIYAVNIIGIKSKNAIVIDFKICKPYWETVWFILGSFLLVFLVIWFSIKLYVRKIQRKELEKTRINNLLVDYQLTALKAQMNPHFIFNAINSIQTYILEKNTDEAYDYLAKFAKLIRMVLNNAKEKVLTLEKELELLNIYIALEQMRFEDRFEVEIIIDPSIDTYQIELPPMLIQPYVENAIWHGLMPLKKYRKGKLKIEIKEHSDALEIIVEDNGVGRGESKKLKKTPEHKSIGMELTQQRVEVLKNVYGNNNVKIIVNDLYDINQEPIGTRIEIIIPLNK